MTISFEQFKRQFKFRPRLRMHLGVEEELLLVDRFGKPVPRALDVLALLRNPGFTYELSACQVEYRTLPFATAAGVVKSVQKGRKLLRAATERLGVGFTVTSVAPEDMPLDVYPDERYVTMVAPSLTSAQLSAACRVMGTHVHVGVSSLAHGLRVYNALVRSLPQLYKAAGSGNSARLALYKVVKPDSEPPLYNSVGDFYERAGLEGFASNPRNCWHLVRMSRYGTVEVRLFPATRSVKRIGQWAGLVQAIARQA